MKNLHGTGRRVLLLALAGLAAGCSWFEGSEGGGTGTGTAGSPSNSNLGSLALSVGGLDQPFASGNLLYTATVANGFDQTTVTAATLSNLATMTVNGMAVGSGAASPPIALAEGANPITIEVTSGDATTTTTYVVTVTRLAAASTDATLASLAIAGGVLTPGFAPGTTMYDATVQATRTETTVTATPSSSTATMTVGGTALGAGTPSAPIALMEGVNVLMVVVTAEDGTTTETYSIAVTRPADATLSALAMSAGAFDQAFSPTLRKYTATVPFTASTTTVTATTASATATLHVDGKAVASGTPSDPIALAEGTNTIVVDVTGGDGTTMLAYEVEVVRRAGSAFGDEGYFKSASTDSDDLFGYAVALSADGDTLAVGVPFDDSGATGIDGDPDATGGSDSGAVYVFVQNGSGVWSQQAYVKASNAQRFDEFGTSLALSADGNTLAVGARYEGSFRQGAAYVFGRDGSGVWTEQAYLTASNAEVEDVFGWSVALSGDGLRLAVGATSEDSAATGIDGDETDNGRGQSGAVYVFLGDGAGNWSQEAYVKASNSGDLDTFGYSVDLDDDGNTLVVGAPQEKSKATGIGGDQADDTGFHIGAAYVFTRDGSGWSQQAYVKASNAGQGDRFAHGIAVSANGDRLAAGAISEDSSAKGVNGNQNADTNLFNAGAVYVFDRDGTGTWTQSAYVKSSNTAKSYGFGQGIALFGDTLAVSEPGYLGAAGAVHLYMRDGSGTWSHDRRIVPQVSDGDDNFGGSQGDHSRAVDLGGGVLAVGAPEEDSSANGIGVGQADNSASKAGAAYVFE